MNQVTVGNYLAQRLEEVGVRDYFAIPGDFNLSLLDELLKNPRLKMINCCNELNAGYAADGYAREKGVAAVTGSSDACAIARFWRAAASFRSWRGRTNSIVSL